MVMQNFRTGKIWVLVCTDLMSRGIDFKSVQLVINYDFPQVQIMKKYGFHYNHFTVERCKLYPSNWAHRTSRAIWQGRHVLHRTRHGMHSLASFQNSPIIDLFACSG